MKYITTLCLLFPLVMNAQQFVNTGTIIVSKESFIKVGGTLTNQDGAIIYSLGEMHVSGDLVNHDPRFGFSSLTHKVVLTGNNQLIGGSKPWHFAMLELGSGIKILDQPIAVGYGGVGLDYQLDLGDAILKLNSKMLNLRGSNMAIKRGTGFIESETNSGVGLGTINWETVNTAAGTKFIFPFGNSAGNQYLPVWVTILQQAPATSSLSAATYPTAATLSPNNRPLPTTVTHFNNSSDQDMSVKALDRFWIINGINYTDGSKADLELAYRDEEWNTTGNSSNNINETALKPVSWNGSAWALANGNVNAATNRLTITGQPLSPSVLSAWESGIALPVTLLSFTGTCENGQIEIRWTTTEEINTQKFVVQYSNDAVSWANKHEANANNAGNATNQYQAFLQDAAEGYYRLKMIDLDGSFSFGRVVRVSCSSAQMASIGPNPTNGLVKIGLGASSNYMASIVVTDMNGKILERRSIAVNAGNNFYNIDLGSYSAGTYHIQVIKGNEKILSRLIIKRN